MIDTATDGDRDGGPAAGSGRLSAPEIDPEQPPSMRAVAAVAAATGRDPTAMAPIFEAIDPDALDRLVGGDAAVRLTFEYEGHRIEIEGDRVAVDGTAFEVGER